jgi:hypothetical protein
MGILLLPVIEFFLTLFYGIGSVIHLEIQMCSQKYYDPVAKDLAIICSNIETDPNMIEVPSIWWPYSVAKLEPIRGYISSDGASVLYTCGFSHLAYKLEKDDDNNSSNRWKLYFTDEGREKHLTTIELSGNDVFNFDEMYKGAKWKYSSQLKKTNELKQNTERFLTLFGKKETDVIEEYD